MMQQEHAKRAEETVTRLLNSGKYPHVANVIKYVAEIEASDFFDVDELCTEGLLEAFEARLRDHLPSHRADRSDFYSDADYKAYTEKLYEELYKKLHGGIDVNSLKKSLAAYKPHHNSQKIEIKHCTAPKPNLAKFWQKPAVLPPTLLQVSLIGDLFIFNARYYTDYFSEAPLSDDKPKFMHNFAKQLSRLTPSQRYFVASIFCEKQNHSPVQCGQPFSSG